ncbi:beta-N-acetylhexosaminidase [Sediminicola luteus]|uniref:beta-N-acetylhexosaminidase n=1 Tax=Sediminicola luteus TaxID=319238 RepID=A0A2A4GDY8_9FLAO|nr:family 20 glycosylhydrolase [Sediminicola luteus]PCE65972.1 hypothetical protein B7P33_01325 [Sediminicola luteus]
MRYLYWALVTLFLSACSEKKVVVGQAAVIPKPQQQTNGKGHFVLSQNLSISIENDKQQAIVSQFFGELPGNTWQLSFSTESQNPHITLTSDGKLAEEAYSLQVTTQGIQIKSGSESGFFYALQTLKQLMPVESLSANSGDWGIPAVNITDAPEFGWRGYMLDVSRHFFDTDEVKKVIDFMAEQKLNRFHWHLTDDQGWRIEIKSYPKLTEVGAWRVDHNETDESISNWWGRPVQKDGEKATYGGFYTQEDIKDIVAYAKARFIEVIPEIDMPGHAQATIAAYPEIGCVNAAPYVATGGVYKNNTYNPGKEETFVFAETMLNEVMDLFPFNYVHIGGDECNKEQWKLDPFAQKRMKDEGLKDEHELQSYFIKRIEKMINARGKIMIGWDEILEGGLAPNATVMSWRGEAGGLASVKAGHEVIMTPNKYCYIDLKQGHDDMEPNLGYDYLLLSTAYNYQVVPDSLTAEEGRLIKGIQANLWTESISDWGKLTYMTYPRLFAIAENAWTAPDAKDWDDFTERLAPQLNRLDAQGVRYATSAYSPWIDHKADGKQIRVALHTEVNGLDIRYTTDGTEPTSSSTKYTDTLSLTETATLKARSFKDGNPMGYVATMHLPVHQGFGFLVKDSTASRVKELPKLSDLQYGKLNNGDPNWQYLPASIALYIDFDTPKTLSQVSFNALRFTISGIYPPEKVAVFGLDTEGNYSQLGTLNKTEEAGTQGRNKIRYKVALKEMPVSGLRIDLDAINPILEGHHRAGGRPSMRLDELVLE